MTFTYYFPRHCYCDTPGMVTMCNGGFRVVCREKKCDYEGPIRGTKNRAARASGSISEDRRVHREIERRRNANAASV